MNFLALVPVLLSFGQLDHHQKPQEAMKALDFMVGDWKGTQTFITPGDPLVGKATDHVEFAVGGRFLEERLSTTLPDKGPTDTRHMLGFDPKTGKYRAYWFNDTSPVAMEMDGELDGNKLTLMNSPKAPGAPHLRFTYTGGTNSLTLTFEMEQGETWKLFFKSEYTK